MEILFLIMVFVLGACLGSFVNMLVYRVAVRYGLIRCEINKRLPRRPNKSGLLAMTNDRSFCDYCGKQLRWFENIPIVSWLAQRGKARCCSEKLPVTYPIVEIITGLLFLLNYELRITNYELISVSFVLSLVVITMLVFSAVFDFKYMILPDFSTVILVVCAVLVGQPQGLPLRILVGAGAGGFLLFLHVITKGKGMGMGDVKYALFMGLFLGPEKIVFAFYVAFVVGAGVGLVLMVIKKLGRKSVIPFGPFLILGTIAAWWWGAEISSIIQKVLQ